jgi:PGF-CTERM protein
MKSPFGYVVFLSVTILFFSALGAGTAVAQSPVEIESVQDLQTVPDDLDGDYVLVNDINASEARDFEPIGDGERPFTGTFDGNGYVVTGLEITDGESERVGLFGKIGRGGVVKDVSLRGVSIVGGQDVGGLAGSNAGTVRGSTVSGSVEGKEKVGGLAGRNIGEINGSSSTASVSGDLHLGGLVGRNVGEIRRSYAEGEVRGGSNAGGLVGYNLGSVSRSYATGDAEGDVTVGGLVGHNRGDGMVSESYAVGNVEATSEYSGLIGLNSANAERSYFDVVTTGEKGRFRDELAGTGLETDEMTGEEATENMEGFDFENTWRTDDGYPVLQTREYGDEYDTGGATDEGTTDEGDRETNDGGETEPETGGDEGDDEGDDEGNSEYQDVELPGFGLLVALAALLCVSFLRRDI